MSGKRGEECEERSDQQDETSAGRGEEVRGDERSKRREEILLNSLVKKGSHFGSTVCATLSLTLFSRRHRRGTCFRGHRPLSHLLCHNLR